MNFYHIMLKKGIVIESVLQQAQNKEDAQDQIKENLRGYEVSGAYCTEIGAIMVLDSGDNYYKVRFNPGACKYRSILVMGGNIADITAYIGQEYNIEDVTSIQRAYYTKIFFNIFL